MKAAKTANAIVAVRRLAFRRSLQIPTRAEELLPRAGDKGNAQLWVITELGKDIAHNPTGRRIDCIGLGPIQGDFQNGAPAFGFDWRVGHLAFLP